MTTFSTKSTLLLWIILGFSAFPKMVFAQTIEPAQKHSNKAHILKAYIIIDPYSYRNVVDNDTVLLRQTVGNVGFRPTFAYEKVQANGRFFQVSLNNLDIRKRDDYREPKPQNGLIYPTSGSEISLFSLSVLTEWGFPIYYSVEKKDRFLMSLAVGEFINSHSIKPYSTAAFPSRNSSMGLNVGVIPRWQHHFNSRCFLDVNVPIMVGTASYEYRYFGNPVLPTYARTVHQTRWTWTPKDLIIRVGLGVKI